jgi:hypothetical protein
VGKALTRDGFARPGKAVNAVVLVTKHTATATKMKCAKRCNCKDL